MIQCVLYVLAFQDILSISCYLLLCHVFETTKTCLLFVIFFPNEPFIQKIDIMLHTFRCKLNPNQNTFKIFIQANFYNFIKKQFAFIAFVNNKTHKNIIIVSSWVSICYIMLTYHLLIFADTFFEILSS